MKLLVASDRLDCSEWRFPLHHASVELRLDLRAAWVILRQFARIGVRIENILLRGAVGVRSELYRVQHDREVRRRLPLGGKAPAGFVLIVEIVLADAGHLGGMGIAVVLGVLEGAADRESIRDRYVERARAFHVVVVAEASVDVASRAVGGRFDSDDVDGAAGRSLTKQRALRPAQHFDLGDVEGVLKLAGIGADGHAVHHDAYGGRLGLLDVGIGEAADRDIGGLRAGVLLGDKQAGCGALQVADVHGRLVLQHGGVDGGNRDRRGLQRFRATPRGDNDFRVVDTGLLRGRGRDWGWSRRFGHRCLLRASRRNDASERACRKCDKHRSATTCGCHGFLPLPGYSYSLLY